MVQATTPTFVCTVDNSADLSEIAVMYFSLKQDLVEVQKSGTDVIIDGQKVSVYLTQAETLPFRKGQAEVMLNWTYSNGARGCTYKKVIQVEDNLLQKVVE